MCLRTSNRETRLTMPLRDQSALRRDYLAVFFLAAVIFCVAHGAGMLAPWQANDDTRQQVFWMQSFSNASLYPDDPLSRYASYYVPQALQILYRLACPIIPAITFSKILTGFLFIILSIAFFGFGSVVGGRTFGWCLACTTWLMPAFLYNMSGGISRSFAAPLMVLFLWRQARGDAFGQAAALILQALLIPYVYITCATASLLSWIGGRLFKFRSQSFPTCWLHWMTLVSGFFLVWLMGHRFDVAGYGPLAGVADMNGHPEFSALGRLELYPQPGIFMDALYYPFERIGLFLEFGLGWGIASLIVLGLYLAWQGPRVSWKNIASRSSSLIWLLLAGSILYITARILLLKLFVPDRYLSIPLGIAYALGIAAVVSTSLQGQPARLKAALLCVCVVLACWRLHGQGLFDYSGNSQCYLAVRELPVSATLAGPPRLMDDVMTFGQRKALVTYKLAHVWSLGWWSWYEPRLKDLFKAYYSADPEEVKAFCRKYGVNYLVVDENDYSRESIGSHPFFAPFDSYIQTLTHDQIRFALLDGTAFPYTRAGKGIRIIEVQPVSPEAMTTANPN
jgi:hypothetical protein